MGYKILDVKADLIKVYENTPYDEVQAYLAKKQKVYGEKWADEAWDLYDKWSSGN
jgi:hypothetical protein|tara:strand:- start:145 stop:309 length:165 start_codon:yes stop_codon:yes gene_type:complete